MHILNKFIIFVISLFAASNLLPVATAGFENCIYCHGTLTAGVPYINLTSLNNSIHGRINNTDDLNYACYACHWDGTPPRLHAKDRSQIKSCEDCHVSNLFQAPLVTEHIPNGQDIKTSIDCISCHSNSVDGNAGYTEISDRVAHFGTTTNLMSPTIRSTDCIWCHYDNSASPAWGTPKDPRVSGAALDHTPFSSNEQCYSCHVSGGSIPQTFHSSSLGRGGGRDCVSCHDIGGAAPKLVDVSATNDNKSVHSSLNANAVTSLNRNNLRCWACHGEGDGSEAAQPSGGHPSNYKTPKNCDNNDCHSLSQSPNNETMVYSHFQNASLNGNPENTTNYNITATAACEICHINSLVKKDTNSGLALASHYGSRDNLVDSFNCIYCHLNKDNSEDWGNATLINKNRTSVIELEKEQNKLTVSEGEKIYLGEGYSLEVKEISDKRNEALVQLLKNDSIADEVSLGAGTSYKYEKEITVDNSTFKTPVIILNILSIFRGEKQKFIQLGGYRISKTHTEEESKNTACYACHLSQEYPEKERYLVLDKEHRNPNDIIYYSRVLVDFKSENKSKIYFNDEDYVFSQIENNFSKFLSFSSPQKYLKEGETWNIADNYSLKLKEVSTESKQAWLTLTIDNIVEEQAVTSGSEFKYIRGLRYKEYTETNVTIFIAKIAAVAQGKPNFVILEDVVAISPIIMKTTANTTLFGYNSSWFKPNDTFTLGKIPENLHYPNLYIDQKIWADCVKCHDISKKLRISNLDAMSSRLGKHSKLNINASNKTLLSDPIDRACWACHSDGIEPKMHSPTYITPRNCKSCHTYQEKPSYGAINISDEPHGSELNCASCHLSASNSHNLVRFEVSPAIIEAKLSPTKVNRGEKVKLVARTSAGYRMKIRAAEYFLDRQGISGNGTPLKPLDGIFDSQKEEVTAELNTTEISEGEHLIYIHALERDNRWGDFYPVNFTIAANGLDPNKNSPGLGVVSLIIALILAYLAILKRGRR